MKAGVALIGLVAVAMLPAPAVANSAAASYFRARADRTAVPRLLSEEERAFYRDLLAAIRRQDWAKVQALFTTRPDGPLHRLMQAEYYLAPGSPKIDLAALNAWFPEGTDLPQAEQVAALAFKRGAATLPLLPQPQPLLAIPGPPRRARPRATGDGTMPASNASAIQEAIKADNPDWARTLLDTAEPGLSPEARAEWRARVAWAFYIANRDGEAFGLALAAAQGGAAPPPAVAPAPVAPAAAVAPMPGSAVVPPADGVAPLPPPPPPVPFAGPTAGPWVAEGWWTMGLAAWRGGDCARAGEGFAAAARATQNPELASAAFYWQARAAIRCRHPNLAAEPLKAAAARDETLYGMLAAEQLGLKLPATHAQPDFTAEDWQALRAYPNVRAAVALAEIGEDGLADDVLRHQARIGDPALYQPLARLARDLGLPGTQLWMASNVPGGATPEPAGRYPTPKWTPAGGWQVDPALVYAHTLQESLFRTRAVSPAGARGLMQIMPAAARDHAAEVGVAGTALDLARPEVNLAFGQNHLAMLRAAPGTQGLLPKVVAAYNAGLQPVTRWNSQIRDGGDPLLWVESIPYWETRGYVAAVLRNYWMYERQAGGASESRQALAQGAWPEFPGLGAARALRVTAARVSWVESPAEGDQ